ncbi:MAG TPA: YCF48-related protein [Bryobacteraceae bacterium]|nr:YCF48-related protein [Bryobacteraceae bacterium]
MKHEHPNANLLAAFAEKRLLAHEREELLAHLAECADCREVLALTSVTDQGVPAKRLSPAWRWMAAAAAACLILTGVWGLRLMSLLAPNKAMPPAAITSPNDIALSSAPADIVQPQIAPAPKAAARPGIRKHPKPLPVPKEQPVARELAPKYISAPMARGLALTAAQGFLPRTRVLWSVAAPVVQRSSDGGITWHPVSISEGAEFHAVASVGSEVWAGGSHGVLFHSSDAGASWKQVAVGGGGEALNGTIVAIRLSEASEVILETDSGQQWISRDGGTSWQRL